MDHATATVEMPRYQCHKQVWALEIKEVRQSPADVAVEGGSWELVPANTGYAPITVTHAWYTKHRPIAGGYYVQYKDGYSSFSPKEAFEEGYTPVNGANQGDGDPIEQEIKDKGLTAPRVTPADVEAEIANALYFTAYEGVMGELLSDGVAPTQFEKENAPQELKLLTFCVLVLRNGFTVTGESACASPENFNAELGRKIARIHAVEKIWPLLGFRLRDQLTAPERNEPASA